MGDNIEAGCGLIGCGAVSTLGGFLLMAAGVTGIVVGSIGLAGRCSVNTVNTVAFSTSFVQPVMGTPQLIISVLGITGYAGIGTVSGVMVASSALGAMVGSVLVVVSPACCVYGYKTINQSDLDV